MSGRAISGSAREALASVASSLRASSTSSSTRVAAVSRRPLLTSRARSASTASNPGGRLATHGATSTSPLHLSRRRVGTARLTMEDAAASLGGVRHASFARFLPRLALKFVRLPAMLGGTAIAGVAWLQYQAAQAGTYVWDMLAGAAESLGGAVGGVAGAAGEAAGSVWDTARDVASQVGRGWDRRSAEVKEGVEEAREWLRRAVAGEGGSGGEGGPGGEPKKAAVGAAAAGAATAGALGYASDTEDGGSEEKTEEEAARDDQMMVLTRKMIEIRNMLQKVGRSSTLTLPSIVVIGSQSSGKSSVLEAIVGHEFLPKGSNMVTRRPIELTLVNTPDSTVEYGEFPDLGLGRITDFSSIQRTLTELNLAVPDSECVSDDPIHLTIHSPNVPDLSLIDLPGYIQVVGRDQPLELKQKIAELCDRYIQPPNVILAISAADVDLANSAALRASRRVDPRGERTIGVITKMDLVDAPRGAAILTDKQYPLRLGYVGVVSRVPPATGGGLFKKSSSSGNISAAIARNERAYFEAHPLEFGEGSGVAVGTATLRHKLMHVLEQTMSASLQSTSEAIRQELEEATYEFKVQYNDRPLSAESYLAESLDSFKHAFKQFSESFGKPQMAALLKEELDQRVLDLLAQRYWNKPIEDLSPAPPDPNPLSSLPRNPRANEDPYWRRQLDASTSALTKSGIGRAATTAVAAALQSHVDTLVARSTFAAHPSARNAIAEACSGILNDRFYSTSDQVENCIKPFKFDVELSDAEWTQGRDHVTHVLNKELAACEGALKSLEGVVGGRRKLREVMSFVDKARRGEISVDGIDASRAGAGGFSAALLAKGREAVFLRDRADIIKMRLLAVRSRQCTTQRNRYQCPEAFLDAVASKLAAVSVLFLNVELLSEFYYAFPRELDLRLGGRHMKAEDIERFAAEDPKIRRHLDVIRRKELLELVLDKIDSLRQLEGRERLAKQQKEAGSVAGRERGRDKAGRWSIF